jgi:hypothetical protein
MSTARFEAFLAKIYVDADARAQFLADPRGEAMRAGLSEPDISALEKIDRIGLKLTAQSLQHKRSRSQGIRKRRRIAKYFLKFFSLITRESWWIHLHRAEGDCRSRRMIKKNDR